MRKATQKTTPVSLGTKRSCSKCGTKFYDFNKEEIVCPKCDTKLDPDGLAAPIPRAESKKASKIADSEDSDVVVGGDISESDEAFESVDDLDDEEDEIVEDIEVDKDEEGDF